MAGKISVRAKREITSALAERYRSSGRLGKDGAWTSCAPLRGGIPSIRYVRFGHARQLGRARSRHRKSASVDMARTVKDTMTALWEASDQVCGRAQGASRLLKKSVAKRFVS